MKNNHKGHPLCLHEKKADIQDRIAVLNEELNKINDEIRRQNESDAAMEYESELRTSNPEMWFFDKDTETYFHITKVINTSRFDIVRHVRQIVFEYDLRVSFGYDSYIKSSVENDTDTRYFDLDDLIPVSKDAVIQAISKSHNEQLNLIKKIK